MALVRAAYELEDSVSNTVATLLDIILSNDEYREKFFPMLGPVEKKAAVVTAESAPKQAVDAIAPEDLAPIEPVVWPEDAIELEGGFYYLPTNGTVEHENGDGTTVDSLEDAQKAVAYYLRNKAK